MRSRSWIADPEDKPTRIHAFWCPVCEELRSSETCPNCPDVLLLRVWKELTDDYPMWRSLA